jgi:hypothetical protein
MSTPAILAIVVLPLSLLVLRDFTDHAQHAVPLDDLALLTALLD